MIRKVKIQNFKSIQLDEVELPEFGAIVGKNAVGKTNFLQAIGLIHDLALGSSVNQARRKISLVPEELFCYRSQKKELKIELELSSNDDKKYKYSVVINLVSKEQGKTLAIKEEKLVQINGKEEEVFTRIDDELFAADKSKVPLDLGSDYIALFQYKHPDVATVRSIFNRVTIHDLERIDLRNSIVSSTESGLGSKLVRLRHSEGKNFQSFQEIIKKMLPSFSSIVEIPSISAPTEKKSPGESESMYLVLLEEKDINGRLSMETVSAGDLRTLYVIASTIDAHGFSTIIFEEIENGLHIDRLKNLIQRLRDISKRRKIQIIFTTHSPYVINKKLSPEEVIFVNKTDDSGTKFYPLVDAEELYKIGEFLKEGGELTEYLQLKWKK